MSWSRDRGPAVRLPVWTASPFRISGREANVSDRRGHERREGAVSHPRRGAAWQGSRADDDALRRGTGAWRIVLADWSAQADTTLSPTAGWGVPVNAIEFSLSADAPSSPASIFVTLAATSVGRGWDCVGHRPGTYRNRIRLEPATAAAGVFTPRHAEGHSVKERQRGADLHSGATLGGASL